jgi:translation initiation factor 3 subunit I
MGHECEIMIFDVAIKGLADPCQSIPVTDSRVTAGLWSSQDRLLVTGHENGDIRQYDPRKGEKHHVVKKHTKIISDLQLSKDKTMLISASKDATAKLFDADTLQQLKTYKTERPVNSATISSIKDHVILGGGQEAMDVTTTATRLGKFDARFFHLVFEEEIGRVKGHFGPINSVTFHPDGKRYGAIELDD